MKKIVSLFVGAVLLSAAAFGICPNFISQTFTVGINQQTFTLTLVDYEVTGGQTSICYELTSDPAGTSLSHFVIELCPDLKDAFVGATYNGAPVSTTLGPDPTTGVNGVKVEQALNGVYCFTFDGGWSLGCSMAALKQGNATAPIQQEIEGLDCGMIEPPGDHFIGGYKFYDANTNGAWDIGEPALSDWWISVTVDDGNGPNSFVVITDENGHWTVPGEEGWTYMASEMYPNETNWIQTFPVINLYQGIFQGEVDDLNFGNVALGGGGGHTLGFWSNKNGQNLVGNDDLQMLINLNLRNANGTDFDPANKTQLKSWLLNANATNMAYMLSVQMAAMQLSVHNGFVDGNALVYAPGTGSANGAGFATVADLMAEANGELGLHGLTLTGSPDRSYQELLKNALDAANNNMTFVLPVPPSYSFGP